MIFGFLVLTIWFSSVGNYWMRSLPDPDPRYFMGPAPPSMPDFANGRNVAILRYIGAPETEPSTPPNDNVPKSKNPLNENDLEPFVDQDAPGLPELGKADVSLNLVSTFNATGDNLFAVGGQSFKAPAVPILLQIRGCFSTLSWFDSLC